MTSTIANAVAIAWTRWQRYHQLHHKREDLSVAEMEVQFELVAIGLALPDEQVQELFRDDAEPFLALLTPLPTFEDKFEDVKQFHFTFVSATMLLDQYLQLSNELEEKKIHVVTGPVMYQVLLPILQLQCFSSLHYAALRMFQMVVSFTAKNEQSQETLTQLFNRVQELLSGQNDKSTICYDTLCRVFKFLLHQKLEKVVSSAMEICKHATKKWRQQPQLLRAVALHIVPELVETESDMAVTKMRCLCLLNMVVDVWMPCSSDDTSVNELLYLVCIIIPKAPRELIANSTLQTLVCFALGHKDALLRKQGLHILKVAFSYCALLSGSQKRGARHDLWLDRWQNFLTASEVIQMHHEQHLIEQVWPQVVLLLSHCLVIRDGLKQQQQDREQWPVQLTFDWMQSLFVRLFSHDNPVVKRLFISNFMETCIEAWQKWEEHDSASTDVDREASFACSPAFQRFVFDFLLRACNDPALFKHTHRAGVQAVLTNFLVSFLAFKFANSDQERVLDEFVVAIKEAIFGEGTNSHSPDALLSMLQIFQSPCLKRAASFASSKDLLSETAVDQLRFLLDVYAMQSFSQAMRTKMLRALSHALTGGFVSASTLSLSALARVHCVFPISSLVADAGEVMLQLLAWMKIPTAVGKPSILSATLASAIQTYVLSQVEANPEGVLLSPTQLARLLLFTAEVTHEDSKTHYIDEKLGHQGNVKVLLRAPLSALLPRRLEPELNSTLLVLLAAKFEEQVQELLDRCASLPSKGFTFLIQREDFYSGQVSYFFDMAMNVVRLWLDKVSPEAVESGSGYYEKDDAIEIVESAAFLLSQLSTHKMNTTGELNEMSALDTLCNELSQILAAAANRKVFDLALAARCLSIIGSNATVVDSLRAFESGRILPLLLALDTSRRYSGKLDAKCAISLATNKWVLLYDVMKSSTFVDTKFLQTTYGACVEALPTAGMDPLALIQMVNVLSLTLSQLASPVSNCKNGIDQINSLLEEVWMAYIDSKAKPDVLTRAVVNCVFQPVFLLHDELRETMKHWIAEYIHFGTRHRPNVIFHLACRLCQTWRAHPASALSFADELVELLLYKEPLIDEREQLTTDTSHSVQGFQGSFPTSNSHVQMATIVNHAKDRFVRLVVLSFLGDVAVEGSAISTKTQDLMDAVFTRLVKLNVTPEWQKQHMLNSDGFGKKLRSWQALCVVSAHVTKSQLTTLLPILRTAFAVPQLPSVRYYMELFGMRLATKYSREICSGILLPMLRDPNLMPQVGASVLLVSAYLANCKLNEKNNDIDCGELLETMLPWLNTSHGYTRVLAQYLLATILPRHIHQLQQSCSNTPGLRFLEGTARYLSNNKESKRMLRRQARKLDELHPDYESSLLGMLCSGFISEFGELLPRDEALCFSEQLKTAMNELYAQYQLENFTPAPSRGNTSSSAIETKNGALTVQRKVDTTTLLSELPAAMQATFDAARRGDTLNARQRPRQPIIVCASLVDKIPNLAGLARTCEIFNAQKLIVPNLRMTEQDVTFATVSATAHKWMPLEEVRPQGEDLRQALLCWKSEEYTIVAVEQTDSSVSLANYTLPRKMVLVLGREKEGIPVDVLQFVDVCVEIPQFGLVRSLNVHVSGALVLWEYTQQQLMSGALESTL
ncbi:hypothetical protein DD238_002874 [Peronospora effusa]|uniref:tRNA/rRNA methyltransferase SpoU type domain-containing protein n=1 Tax=Peronospora effusa TaxID=542832 RepID=A0A3M6VMX5_9STRA|nr:hypothetical protein DD238_002874 [Peronospora effusa]